MEILVYPVPEFHDHWFTAVSRQISCENLTSLLKLTNIVHINAGDKWY